MHILKKHELLAFVRPLLPDAPIIVEAGSFDGKDTAALAACWPRGHVHAFEPVPAIFQLLEKNTHQLAHVHRYPYALSSATGTAQFHVSEKPSKPGKPFQAGSLHKAHERLQWSDAVYNEVISVPTITVCEWAYKESISHIDFLWLDAQGHELAILQGVGDLLNTVKVIYCEVHFIQAYEGQPLYQEIKNWLELRGFAQVAQDFTNQTDWFFGNALFVKPLIDQNSR